MKIKKITYPLPTDDYNKTLVHIQDNGLEILFGTVFLRKGRRIPLAGFSKHPQHELSIIESGSVEMLGEDNSVVGCLKRGDVVYIPAFEAQAGHVLEDTKIIYFLSRIQGIP